MDQAIRRVGVLKAILAVDAAAIREASPHPRYERALPHVQAVRTPLVVERVAQVAPRLLGLLVARPELESRPQVAVRAFTVDLQVIVDSIGAAEADTVVGVPTTRLCERGLRESVAVPRETSDHRRT